MKASPLFFIAARTMLGRKSDVRDLSRRSMRGAILSVAVSMVPLIVTLVVSDGMISGITSRYIELSSYHIQCVPYLPGEAGSSVDSAVSALRAVPGIRGAWAETQAVGIAFAKGVRGGAVVRAVDPEFLEDPGTRSYLSVISGEAALSGPNDVLVGSELARELGVSAGDVVSLISVRTRTGDSIVPKVSVFRVRGVVSSGYRELDARWFIVPRYSSGRYLTPETSRTLVGVKTEDPYHSLDTVVEGVKAVLPDGWAVYPWSETEKNLYASFNTTRYLLLLIMGLIVLVAVVNISSALVTLVMERSQEIAILKGQGASQKDIGRIFIIGGLILGFTGSALGVVLGTLVAVNINSIISGLERMLGFLSRIGAWILAPLSTVQREANSTIHILNPDYYLEYIPVSLDVKALVAILFSALILSYLASLLPARRAASLSPMEILRHH